ncbi:alpha/beta fold hydrolase [Longimycelium tulufanense]|nr:alpha/beta hydrolase [Longimycelium tulufanense]
MIPSRVGGLHVLRDGPADAPVVVLGPGLGGSCLDWRLVARLLTGHASVVRFDRPGTGHSGPCSGPCGGPPSLRREMAVLAAATGGAPVVLVGHSVAALHMEGFARTRPEAVRGLVLVDPSVEPPDGIGSARSAGSLRSIDPLVPVTRLLSRLPTLPRRLARRVGPAGRQIAIGLGALTRRETGSRAELAEIYGRPEVLRAVLAEYAAYPELVTDLQRLRAERPLPAVPLVVLTAGRACGPNVLVGHRAMAAMSPLGEHVVVPGSRHLMPLDRPDAVALAVRRVLAA